MNIELVGIGTSYRVFASPKEIMCIPFQKKATSIIIIHNHPSCSVTPSNPDIDFTDRLIQIGRMVDMQVIDHMILGNCYGSLGDCYYSFQDYDLIKTLRLSSKYVPSFEAEQRFKKELKEMEKKFKTEIQESKKLAKQEGIQIGQEKGRKLGKKEGEKEKALSIAKVMVKEGESIEKIILFTGLSIKQVEQLSVSN